MSVTMQNTFRKVLMPTVFPEDDAKTRSAFYLNVILLVSVPTLVLFVLIRVLEGNRLVDSSNLVLLGLIVILSIALAILRAGMVRLAAYIHITTIWIASTLLALNGSGIRGSGFASYFVVMLLAGLLLGV